MSFVVELGNTSSATNVVDKEFTMYNNPSGYLRKGSSIIDPVIVLQLDNNDVWRKSCNYAHIDAFSRWYYITNIIALHGTAPTTSYPSPYQLWEVHMHVDVLKTYANEIRQQRAVVARQEAKFNLMLDDGIFMCYQNPKIQTKLFSNPTPFENQEFVLVVAGS